MALVGKTGHEPDDRLENDRIGEGKAPVAARLGQVEGDVDDPEPECGEDGCDVAAAAERLQPGVQPDLEEELLDDPARQAGERAWDDVGADQQEFRQRQGEDQWQVRLPRPGDPAEVVRPIAREERNQRPAGEPGDHERVSDHPGAEEPADDAGEDDPDRDELADRGPDGIRLRMG